MIIEQVVPGETSKALQLLKDSNLPVDDIKEDALLYAIKDNERLFAVIGLEIHNWSGLLRSLCVSPALRGEGKGVMLVRFLEEEARNKQLSEIFLLTETASLFFKKLGYREVKREDVPESIRATTQFRSVCPTTATVMYKNLLP